MKLVIIDYGAGNIQSLRFALDRLGVESLLSSNADEIKKADKVIFPGVGEASTAMKKLRSTSLDQLIPQLNQPVLGICLGMQLMCSYTEEGNTTGLGIFECEVKRFQKNVKVPQMGWNTLIRTQGPLFNQIKTNEYMYLVHSYYVPLIHETVAETNYGGAYSTALQKDNFFGVQFHPEKSSKAGSQLLSNFITL